ncbi:MAG: amino acid permease [Chlamydiales bacterium]|nr:amino acid permease [Chlamydiales bacterium]
MSGHSFEHRRTLNVFVLAMLSLAVVISLRNLPLTAKYGLGSIFFYCAAALLFMIPYALISAELASGWPKAGGVYVWVREALGDRFGFFAIWMQWFHNMTWYPAMLAFIAAGLAHFIDPRLATSKPFLISVILIGFWGITFMNFLGIKTSALVSSICVIIGAILPGAILIGMALYWAVSGEGLALPLQVDDLIPDLTPMNLSFLAGIFLALSGLEANANLAREVKHPQKNYPRAILIAALLTLSILILGSLAIALVIPQEEISLVSGLLDTFSFFFNAFDLMWMMPLLLLMTVLGALGELNAWAIAGVKGLFVTTEHGCLPPLFHKVNRRHTPVNLMLFQAIIVTIASFAFLYFPDVGEAYWLLSALSAQMYLLMYILLFVSGIVLRYRHPNVHRAYRVPFKNFGIWTTGIVGIGSAFFALFFSFAPPVKFFRLDILPFETLIIAGFIINCAIPLIIYSLRKPHWKLKVLKEIREEIHDSINEKL